MTDFELPKWAKIVGDIKVIRCPKCNGWLAPTHRDMVYQCQDCGFKVYENKAEAYWVKNEQKLLRLEKLDELGIAPTDTYFCTKCRVNHVAGTKIGFMHLDYRGEKEKLRVCVIPNCGEILTGKQKKYCESCSKGGDAFVRHQQTCKKCGYYFGRKGDGFQVRRLCFECDAKDKGATISDWESLGLDATANEEEFRKMVFKLRRERRLDDEKMESVKRILDYYTKRS